MVGWTKTYIGPILGAAWARMPVRLPVDTVSHSCDMEPRSTARLTQIRILVRSADVGPCLVEVVEHDVGMGEDGIGLGFRLENMYLHQPHSFSGDQIH